MNIDKTQQYILLGAESSIGEKKLVTYDGRRLIEISHIRYYNMTSYSHIIRKYMRKKCIIFFIVLKKTHQRNHILYCLKKHDILQKKNPLKRIIFYSIYKETRSNRINLYTQKHYSLSKKTMKTVPYSVLYSKKLKTKHSLLVSCIQNIKKHHIL